ncbi:MAG: DUF885 domain-containing protein [Candidatus Thermoplasmatota archaeon]
MANTLFLQFTERVLDEVLGWDPAHATQLGWDRYDHSVRDLSPEAFARQAARLRAVVKEFQGFQDGQLSEEERIDRDLAIHLFRVRIFEIEELRMHERMAMATEDLGSSLFFLFTREDRPLEKRIDAITSRLEKVPEYLERSKPALTAPCRLWTEIALETGRALLPFIDTIDEHASAMFGRTDRTARLSSAARCAKEALDGYNRWLADEVLPRSGPDTHMAADVFERYMRLKGFDITPDEALEVGSAHLARTRDRMALTAGRMVRSGSVDEALHLMKSMHPVDFDEVLACYRRDIQRARDFLVRKDLATVPDGEKLRVIETPTFMRHVAPFAAQFEPGKFTGARTGMFLVTPSDNKEILRDHCYPLISNTAVHEGYPGHHLQGICANTHPSFVRVLSNSMDFGEGWALYCEELMLDQGFNDTPEGRLAQLSDLMFRVVRVIADVKLSRGETTPDEVAEMLVRETSMQRDAALSEARSYTYCPTYYLSYFIGKLALLQLLEDVRRATGDRFSMKLFHDTLLYAGCLPIPFMRREIAMRLREEYGVELGEPRERLVDFALREAAK